MAKMKKTADNKVDEDGGERNSYSSFTSDGMQICAATLEINVEKPSKSKRSITYPTCTTHLHMPKGHPVLQCLFKLFLLLHHSQ